MSKRRRNKRKINGEGVAEGFAMGRVRLVRSDADIEAAASSYVTGTMDEEMERVWAAAETLAKKLDDAAEKRADDDGDEAAILCAESEMVTDSSLHDAIADELARGKSTPYAIRNAARREAEKIAAVDDAYIKERSNDVIAVGRLLIKELCGIADAQDDGDGPLILVASDATADTIAALPEKRLCGIMLGDGSATCHAAILARARGIPALVGIGSIIRKIEDGMTMMVEVTDGESFAMMEPTDEEIAAARESYNEAQSDEAASDESFGDVLMRDDYPVLIRGNVTSASEIAKVITRGADGVGLFRSEFLFLGRETLPTEDEQYDAYRKAAEAAGSHPCVIRLLDAGGDKPVPQLTSARGANPMLDMRGIRLLLSCDENRAVLRAQLKAILRASAHGHLAVLIPMVTDAGDAMAVREIIDAIEDELRKEGVPFDEALPVGAMIETPAAAVLAESIASAADFFSIGTNDLTQYTLSIDRMSADKTYGAPAYLHPAVLGLIQMAIDSAEDADIPVTVCGEMAGDTVAAPLLAAMGVTALSMDASNIVKIQNVLEKMTLIDAQELLDVAQSAQSPSSYAAYAQEKIKSLENE